jgi:hypothetical protein
MIASWSSTATLCIAGLLITTMQSSGKLIEVLAAALLAVLFLPIPIFVLVCLLSGIPAVIAMWLSEKLGVRSVLFFGCIGAAIGALDQIIFSHFFMRSIAPVTWLFALAGLVGGTMYWAVAGKQAGQDSDLSTEGA